MEKLDVHKTKRSIKVQMKTLLVNKFLDSVKCTNKYCTQCYPKGWYMLLWLVAKFSLPWRGLSLIKTKINIIITRYYKFLTFIILPELAYHIVYLKVYLWVQFIWLLWLYIPFPLWPSRDRPWATPFPHIGVQMS